jgi:drug/metabolite transporter (DMT)-like permease
VGVTAVWAALLLVVVGVIAGASTGVGDSLPRTSPTFAAWSNLAILATAFTFAVTGAMLAAVFDRAASVPVLAVVIGCGLTLGFAAPLTVGTGVRTVAATDSRPRRRN